MTITGYTDSLGTKAANRRLSLERANEVLAYVFGGRVPAGMIVKASGRNATQFVASNATAAGRARNRRATVNVLVRKAVR